jgi:hypothetical protein
MNDQCISQLSDAAALRPQMSLCNSSIIKKSPSLDHLSRFVLSLKEILQIAGIWLGSVYLHVP